MRVLHLASFRGNIGDNISHGGLGTVLDQYLGHYSVQPLEIRRYYQNYRGADRGVFNRGFIDLINSYDLVIMGGGGFLEYHFPDSCTGTTFDIEPALLSGIRTPTLMTSLGCDVKKAIPKGNRDKFRFFMDALIENPKIQVALRNDGSYRHLLSLDEGYESVIPEVLDNGFFYRLDRLAGPQEISRDYAIVNIPSDQLRMTPAQGGVQDERVFFRSLSEGLRYLVENKGLDLVFVPHVHVDLQAITEIIDRLPDELVRNHVSVAPCIQGQKAARYQSRLYRDARLVLAGRLHANICALVAGVPVLGLSVLGRVRYLYESVGLEEWYLGVEGDFTRDLVNKSERAMASVRHFQISEKPDYRALENTSLRFYREAFSSL